MTIVTLNIPQCCTPRAELPNISAPQDLTSLSSHHVERLPKMSGSKGKAVPLKFITYNTAPDPQDENVKREVRSHVTRMQHRKKGHRIYTKRKQRVEQLRQDVEPQQELGIVDAEDGSLASSSLDAAEIFSTHGSRRTRDRDVQVTDTHSPSLPLSPSAERLARASSIASNVSRQTVLQDPADQMASILKSLKLDFPTVMEHYRWIVYAQSPDFEATFMPELPRGAGYETLISRIARDPALVGSAALVATGHILAIRNTTMSRNIARCILELKEFVLNTVNEALRDPARATSDPLICAILILASHEGLQGRHESFHIHMRGLVQMINLRGGLSQLNGDQKFLEAFIMWQDTNVSTLMGCEPYWKQAHSPTEGMPAVRPNPAMWLLKEV